jgi:hypothetical protein
MYELYFAYNFTTFSVGPRRDILKIPECKIKKYDVANDNVELVVVCESQDIAEKLKHYMLIRFEIFAKKELPLSPEV